MTTSADLERAAAEQAGVCSRVGSPYTPVDYDVKLGLALEHLSERPIRGVRGEPENGTSGWYIWGGDWSDDPDFFKPAHTVHLFDLLPQAVKYLALAPGYKFIIDDEGYEDVWLETGESEDDPP